MLAEVKKYIKAQLIDPKMAKKASIRFFNPPKSAMPLKMGELKATSK